MTLTRVELGINTRHDAIVSAPVAFRKEQGRTSRMTLDSSVYFPADSPKTIECQLNKETS